MNTKTRTIVVALIIMVIFGIALAIILTHLPAQPASTTSNPPANGQPIATASYACSAGKVITAAYYAGETKPATSGDQPPVPGGSVVLSLSDGRTMTLAQTISADGARYANADESVVFWNKGNGVTFTENGQQTYMGCLAVASDPGGLVQVYESGTEGFSLRYPVGFSIDEAYRYQALGPGKDIAGVKFTIPVSMATGTNLSSDSYLSVEEIPQAQTCTADLFLGQGVTAHPVTDGNTDYSVASSTDAGAGNRYEETIYALPGTNPCVAVRYFIHYGVFENYPAGTIKQFDKQAILSQFDLMRRTLVIGQ